MAGQVVIFALDQEEYGMPIEVVREITRLGEVRPIPQAPPYVQGLINLRGQAIPLIDMHVRFGLSQKVLGGSANGIEGPVQNTFALITEVYGNLVGFAVDEVREVRVLDNVLPPPPLVTAPFISGIVNLPGRIIMQLSPERILDTEELEGISNFL
ncbi:MAG: chemotaxis protein CheW [Desulfitobacteriaceae bacterium]